VENPVIHGGKLKKPEISSKTKILPDLGSYPRWKTQLSTVENPVIHGGKLKKPEISSKTKILPDLGGYHR